ncbi:ABC transporter ATP-binding protein [Ruminococcus sp.]|uniref:ABC transporter ATP-binding protein n=1 Tax=Ruminococcus sp. TaxID=41978 RepID=UPI0025D51B1E|nr:ABC transporter ATP-binding protein [Ruminococcus sp.]MBQ8967243.1 ABC transporter ATP-binding protein [Ruminococcus sp.]
MIGMIRQILKFSGKYAKRIRIAYITVFLHSLLLNIPVMAAILTVDRCLNGRLDLKTGVLTAVLLYSAFLLQALCKNLSDRLESGTGYMIFCDKRRELGEHLRRLPMGYFTEGNLGKISSVLSQDMVYIEEQAMTIVADVVSDIFSTILTCVFMFVFHPLLGAVTLAVDILAFLIAQPMIRRSSADAKLRQESIEGLTSAVLEYADGLPVIKSYGMTGESASEMRNAFHASRAANLEYEEHILPYEIAMMLLYGIGMTGILASAVWLFQQGSITAVYFVGVVLFLFSIFSSVKHLFQQSTRLTIMKNSLDRINEIFNEAEITDFGTAKITDDPTDAEIEFQNVSFGYGKEMILRDISFTAKKGQIAALVGESGSGKTTIASLLARFWDVGSGEIRIRNTNIKDVQLSDLMAHISMVFQRVYLFHDTVYNNIAMGSGASREEVMEAAKKARCYEFIMSLPYGFDTIIGEGGATLSGGEAQRISIARCILKDAPIIILDEATASIDADNERCIQEAMSELCRNKTVLVIAHRLYTIANADQIIVMDKGRIAEQGTREELLSLGGIYSRMEAANA